MQPNVLVLYDEPTVPPDHPDAESEREVVDTAEETAEILRQAGCRASPLGMSSDPTPLLRVLRENPPDVVFNLFEGTARQGKAEGFAAGILEWLGIPFTGCPFQALVLARDKPRAKLLLQGAGLPTPRSFVVDRLPVPPSSLGWPVIAKPATEDASVGLDQGSVVTNQEQLNRRVSLLLERYPPLVLVEEYVPGREFNVAIVEAPRLRVLPISEIVFSGQETGRWPIVTYEAKWARGSAEDRATTPCCPANVNSDLAECLRRMAVQVYQIFGCRDYARVDFRVNTAGEPFILEVNPNPDFHSSAGLARALKAAGWSHAEFAFQLVRQKMSGANALRLALLQS